MSQTANFKTTGMHCSSCSMLVTMNLEDLAGVESVKCDFATGNTSVTFDPAQVTVEEIRQNIVDSGYQAEIAQ